MPVAAPVYKRISCPLEFVVDDCVSSAYDSVSPARIVTERIMLIGNNLLRLVDTIKISRRCHRIIMQNVAGTLAVDSISGPEDTWRSAPAQSPTR